MNLISDAIWLLNNGCYNTLIIRKLMLRIDLNGVNLQSISHLFKSGQERYFIRSVESFDFVFETAFPIINGTDVIFVKE